MTSSKRWHDLGSVESLKESMASAPVREVVADGARLALTYTNGKFGAVSGVCNHAAGPLGKGKLDGEYLVCPWHQWKFHRTTGEGEPGFEADKVPAYELKEEKGRLLVNLDAVTKRHKNPHPPHPLERPFEKREANSPPRVLGISTTVMDPKNPRYSTSENLLEEALIAAQKDFGAETKLIKLHELLFRSCEGYYSKGAGACTWPFSITQMDPNDQLDRVYEAIVHWCDVVIIATPIRWGSASSLYFKMAERMNCIQNQITIKNRVLIHDKVAGFIVTGGQDNVQGVVGGLLTFFSELGFLFPPFPFIAHSLGWSAENMERNTRYVQQSKELRDGARALVERCIELSEKLCKTREAPELTSRGGRKSHQMEKEAEA